MPKIPTNLDITNAPSTQSTAETNNPPNQLVTAVTSPVTTVENPVVHPVIFLNTYHQVIKTCDPPNYNFSKTPQGFVAELNYLNDSWKSKTKISKKDAKEEVSTLCIESIKTHFSHNFAKVMRILAKFGPRKTIIATEVCLVEQTPKVVKWYDKERMRSTPKPMRVLLLELCQMYALGYPRFYQKKENDLYYFTCSVDQRSWEPDTGFLKRPEAKDHVATRVFDNLFLEVKTREEEEIKKENDISIEQMRNQSSHPKSYISLLHEMAAKKHRSLNYEYSRSNGGFIAHVNIGDQQFCGSSQISKNAAKEDASRIACGNIILSGDF